MANELEAGGDAIGGDVPHNDPPKKKRGRPRKTPEPLGLAPVAVEPEPEIAPVATPRAAKKKTSGGLPDPFRPSDLKKLIAAEAERLKVPVRDIDPAKFLRANGLPNPLIKFRVVGQKGNDLTDPVIVNETGAPNAIRRAILEMPQVAPKPHQWRMHATPLEV